MLTCRGYAGTTGVGWALHSDIVMPYIARYGTQEQKQKLVPDMTSGKKIGAIAMTEPGAGRFVILLLLYYIRTHI